jgi:dolichol-phosphate mannosyltransferase
MPQDSEAVVVERRLHRRVGAGMRHPQNWFQFARFGLVGASGYAVNLGVFALAVHPLHVGYRVAAVLAFLVSVLNNFWWNRHWTFDGRNGHAGFQAARFFVVSAVAFGFNYAVLVALVELADVPKVPAQAVAIAAATPLNFLGQKLWSFRR